MKLNDLKQFMSERMEELRKQIELSDSISKRNAEAKLDMLEEVGMFILDQEMKHVLGK